jgi:hypothetical protein
MLAPTIRGTITSPRTHRPRRHPHRLLVRCPRLLGALAASTWTAPSPPVCPAARSSPGGAFAARHDRRLPHQGRAASRPRHLDEDLAVDGALQFGSTVVFLINVLLHRIFGCAADPATRRCQTRRHPAKIDYSEVSFRKLVTCIICGKLYELRSNSICNFICLPHFGRSSLIINYWFIAVPKKREYQTTIGFRSVALRCHFIAHSLLLLTLQHSYMKPDIIIITK